MSKKSIHIIVLALNAICLILILQIDFEFIPLIGVEILQDRATKINGLISNLSQGTLISSIFYFLLVYVPEYSKQKSIRIIIQWSLRAIVDQMQKTTAYLDYKYDLHVDYSNINLTCFLGFEDLKDQKLDEILNNVSRMPGTDSPTMTEFELLAGSRSVILTQIQKILQEPGIIYEDEKFIEILSKLRDCTYLASVEFLCTSKYDYLGLQKKSSADFSKGVYDFFIIYNKLSKYYTPLKLVDFSKKTEMVA